jgi:hypothetical protein
MPERTPLEERHSLSPVLLPTIFFGWEFVAFKSTRPKLEVLGADLWVPYLAVHCRFQWCNYILSSWFLCLSFAGCSSCSHNLAIGWFTLISQY